MAKASELKVRPLDDRLVVEPLEAEDKTTGGILLPGDPPNQTGSPEDPVIGAVDGPTVLINGGSAQLRLHLADPTRLGMQIPGQMSRAPKGQRFSRRENALNLCSGRISVNDEMCLGSPRSIPDGCAFEAVPGPPSFRKSFNL